MKKFILLLSGLFGMGLCMIVQAASPVTVGIVDMQHVLQQSPKVMEASAKLKKQFAPEQKELKALQSKIKTMSEKLNRDASVMQAKDKKALQAKIKTEQQDLMQKTQVFQQKAFAAQQKEMHALLSDVTTVVKKIATKEHLTLVLDKGAVVYADDSLDITDQVKNALS